MKKRLVGLAVVLALALGLCPWAGASDLLTVQLPDYVRGDFVLDRAADYSLLPVQDENGVFQGYAGEDGALAIRLDCDGGRLFHDGLAVVKKGGKYGYVDKSGALVIPMKYDYAQDFSEGLAVVTVRNAAGSYRDVVIDKTGRELATQPYIHSYAQGMAWFQDAQGKYGFLDSQGKVAIQPEYDLIGDFSEGRAWAGKLGSDGGYHYGFINKAGTLVIPMDYDYDGCRVFFSQGVAQVTRMRDGRSVAGYINTAGQVVVPFSCTPQVDRTDREDPYAVGASGGVILVLQGGTYSLMSTQGQLIKTLDADMATSAQDSGLTVLSKNGAISVVDAAGQTVVSGYESCGRVCEGRVVVGRNDALGVVDLQGKEIVPCSYEDIVLLPGGKVLVSTTGGQVQGRFYLYGTGMVPREPQRMAYANTDEVEIDGVHVTLQMYALKNSLGYETNYVRLRDVAFLLMDSPAAFNVTWNGETINVWGRSPYTPNGQEMGTLYLGDRLCDEATSQLKVNGYGARLAAILLTDDYGGGYTFVKLRGLGELLGFNVGWSAERGVYVETDRYYVEE